MVYRCDNVEFQLAIGSRLKDTRIDLDFLDSRPVQFAKCCDDSSLFACAGRAIDEEMREIATLSLDQLA